MNATQNERPMIPLVAPRSIELNTFARQLASRLVEARLDEGMNVPRACLAAAEDATRLLRDYEADALFNDDEFWLFMSDGSITGRYLWTFAGTNR